MKEQSAIQNLLQSKFAECQGHNPRYSLRAFAQKLKLSPGALSGILNGKRQVSRSWAEKLANRLCLDPRERLELLSLFPLRRQSIGNVKSMKDQARYLVLSSAQFKIISDWEHFAILSLIRTKKFRGNPRWIASRLGISETRASQAFERLTSLELIRKKENGTWERTATPIRTSDDVADASVRRSHEQTLELAKESLFKHSIMVRDHTSVTLPMDPCALPKIKEAIRRFQDELTALAECSDPLEVYRLAIQFFPLTQTEGD